MSSNNITYVTNSIQHHSCITVRSTRSSAVAEKRVTEYFANSESLKIIQNDTLE